MKIALISVLLVNMLILSMVSPLLFFQNDAPGERIVRAEVGGNSASILFASDIHIGAAAAYTATYDRFIRDINQNLTLDALLLLGDITDSGTNAQKWKYVNQTANLTDYDLKTNNTFALLGNHDTASTNYYTVWENWKNVLGYMPNWTYQIGNILFLGIATTGYQTYGEISDYELTWINNTIKANVDKNIVILSHQPISNTTYYSASQVGSFKVADDTKLRGLAYYHRSNISAWIHGHNHATDSIANITTTWNGIYFADISALESQIAPFLSESYLLNITEGSKVATLNPRHTGVGVASSFNTTNMRSFSFKYPVDLNGLSLKSTASDWADASSVTLTHFKTIADTLWTDLNPTNDSNTWLLYKFNEFGTIWGGNRSIKDWSGRGCNLNYSGSWQNWTNGSGISPANDGGGLTVTGLSTNKGPILKTGPMTRLCNVTKNFTIEMTFKFNSAISGGTKVLCSKYGEFIWGWDTTAWRMSMAMYWSDSTSNTYYLNFAPNHTIAPRQGSIIHFVATVNTFDHYFRGWYNSIYLGNALIASKTMGFPNLYYPYNIVNNHVSTEHSLEGTLLGFKISKIASPNGVIPTSTIVIKNPTQAINQTILGNVIYGHSEGGLEGSSNLRVSYSADNSTFYVDRYSVPNSKTFYMKVEIISDGGSGTQITGVGLRTINVLQFDSQIPDDSVYLNRSYCFNTTVIYDDFTGEPTFSLTTNASWLNLSWYDSANVNVSGIANGLGLFNVSLKANDSHSSVWKNWTVSVSFNSSDSILFEAESPHTFISLDDLYWVNFSVDHISFSGSVVFNLTTNASWLNLSWYDETQVNVSGVANVTGLFNISLKANDSYSSAWENWTVAVICLQMDYSPNLTVSPLPGGASISSVSATYLNISYGNISWKIFCNTSLNLTMGDYDLSVENGIAVSFTVNGSSWFNVSITGLLADWSYEQLINAMLNTTFETDATGNLSFSYSNSSTTEFVLVAQQINAPIGGDNDTNESNPFATPIPLLAMAAGGVVFVIGLLAWRPELMAIGGVVVVIGLALGGYFGDIIQLCISWGWFS